MIACEIFLQQSSIGGCGLMRHWKNGGVLVSAAGGCMSHTCSGAGPGEILKDEVLWTTVADNTINVTKP